MSTHETAAARESARRADGRFGVQDRCETDVELTGFRGSGWGDFDVRRDELLDPATLRPGMLIAEESTWFGSRNLVRVTRVDSVRGVFYGRFADPEMPFHPRRTDDQEFAVWFSDDSVSLHSSGIAVGPELDPEPYEDESSLMAAVAQVPDAVATDNVVVRPGARCGFTVVERADGGLSVYGDDAWEEPAEAPMLPWSPPTGRPVAKVSPDGTYTIPDQSSPGGLRTGRLGVTPRWDGDFDIDDTPGRHPVPGCRRTPGCVKQRHHQAACDIQPER